MSAQTGRPTVAPPPPTSGRVDRARVGIERMRNDPNPVWMRELKQAARLQRTPVVLAVITGMITLLIASIGGVASVTAEPAKVGTALYHTFFSLAFAVVTWVAPAVAAATIASERGGRTWEALLLTGLGPKTIARGKFLASLTYISLYIVMLAPVGMLPFLFGGVTATEVLTAFVLLFLFAVLSVAFGLSISSKFGSSAIAIVLTLLVAIPLSLIVYSSAGIWLSFGMHEIWPGIPGGPPVWLPTAYVRADFGLEYLVFLILAPLALTIMPAWFLYEVTIANMSGVSDDRSTGIRRWFLVSTPLLTLVTLVAPLVAPNDEYVASALGMGVLDCFFVFAAFVFAGEPLGPSRRVLVHWQREGIGRFRRFLGPGVMRASNLLLLMGFASLSAMTAGGVLLELTRGGPNAVADAQRVGIFGGYSAALLLFVVGFTAWIRARSRASTMPRLLLLSALFVMLVGPWIAMAIAGVLADNADSAMVVASPSPSYAIVMMRAVTSTSAERELLLAAGGVAMGAWALLGLGLLSAGGARSRKIVKQHQAALARVEQLLDAEDTGAEPNHADPPYSSADGSLPAEHDPA